MNNENWLTAFAKAFSLSQKKEEDNEIVAEINVKDLPSIIWNEEEYRVLFNEDGTAELLNDFGNHVLTLQATTVDEVNKQLGDTEVIAKTQNKKKANIEQSKKNHKDIINIAHNIKRINKLANELSEDLLIIKQNYARKENFDKETFDAEMEDFNNMMESIKLTQEQINKENSLRVKELKLNDDDACTFMNVTCPCCDGEETLEKTIMDDEFQYIQCAECGKEYKVDLETGDIFLLN